MKRTSILLLALLLYSVPYSHSAADKTLLSAREALLSSSAAPGDAVLKYTEALKKTDAAPALAEYAYALAHSGAARASLFNIDRALIAEPLNPEVRYYLAELLNAFGLKDASDELSAPVPSWLKNPLVMPALDISAPEGDFEKASTSIDLLMAQKRYAQSAVLFDRLCARFPDNARCYAGYAIALEKLGAFKAAAAQAEKNLALSVTAERKASASAYIASLKSRPPVKYDTGKPKYSLKGRWLAFLGGNLNRADGNTVYAFSTRAGRFLSDRLDISANAALNGGNPISDYNGLTLGAAARYNQPLPFFKINGTLATKIERVPAPDKTLTFLISPGFSHFMGAGSLDVYWDLALSGPYSGSVTMSVGYTVYFGGGK